MKFRGSEKAICGDILLQEFDPGGGLVGDTDLGNSCRHLPLC